MGLLGVILGRQQCGSRSLLAVTSAWHLSAAPSELPRQDHHQPSLPSGNRSCVGQRALTQVPAAPVLALKHSWR